MKRFRTLINPFGDLLFCTFFSQCTLHSKCNISPVSLRYRSLHWTNDWHLSIISDSLESFNSRWRKEGCPMINKRCSIICADSIERSNLDSTIKEVSEHLLACSRNEHRFRWSMFSSVNERRWVKRRMSTSERNMLIWPGVNSPFHIQDGWHPEADGNQVSRSKSNSTCIDGECPRLLEVGEKPFGPKRRVLLYQVRWRFDGEFPRVK